MPSAIRPISKPPGAVLRLVCFPFAGGSAGAFRPWKHGLDASIALAGVEYPGHGQRIAEPFADGIGALAAEAARELAAAQPRPTILFGHSMGALVAFEAARRLAGGLHAPAMLVVSGCGGPGARPARIAHLPDEAFVAEVKQFDGTPEGALDHEELKQLALPILRADFRAYETYARAGGAPLCCPILALGGAADPGLPVEDLEPWRAETTGRFERVVLPGKHFFAFDARDVVTRLIAERARELVMADAASGRPGKALPAQGGRE